MKILCFVSLLLSVFSVQAPLGDGSLVHRHASRALGPLVFVSLSPSDEVIEGRPIDVQCLLVGPEAKSCAVIADCERTPAGGQSRGRLTEVVCEAAPVARAGGFLGLSVARFKWTPGWFDAPKLSLKVKFFSADGSLLRMATREYSFEPACLKGSDGTCVVISKAHQRLYVVRNGRLEAVYLVSTGTRHRDGGGPTPAMTTRIVRKTPYAYSRRYHSPMRYWNAITSDGAYGIHATVPSNYRFLGRPASHGCIRLHKTDAIQFYQASALGTTVVVSNL